MIERTFYTESKIEREQWCEAIEHVAFLLSEANQSDQQMSVDETNDSLFGQQDMSSRLHISTTERTPGGGKRIVSEFTIVLCSIF